MLFIECYGGIQRRPIFLRCPNFSDKDRNTHIITVLMEGLECLAKAFELGSVGNRVLRKVYTKWDEC